MLKIREALNEFSEFLDLQETPDSKIFNHRFIIFATDYNVYVFLDSEGEVACVSFVLLKR